MDVFDTAAAFARVEQGLLERTLSATYAARVGLVGHDEAGGRGVVGGVGPCVCEKMVCRIEGWHVGRHGWVGGSGAVGSWRLGLVKQSRVGKSRAE